jgi:drug/metabolite transporter (DMT)-like permease
LHALRVGFAFAGGVLGIACAALFVRFALPASPVVMGFYRMLFATAILGLAVGVRAAFAPRRARAPWRACALALGAGASFGIDIALWQSSLVLTSVANATLLVNTTPIYVGLFTTFVLGERLVRGFVPGTAVAIGGAAVLLGIGSPGESGLRGDLMALGAAIFYAGYLLIMSSARRGLDALSATALMSVAAAAVLGTMGMALGHPFSGFPAHSWLAMAAAACVSQIAGVFGIVWALRFLPTPFASLALLGQPVVAAGLAWVWLGEALGALQGVGAAAVLAGIGFVSLRSGVLQSARLQDEGEESAG